MPNPFLDLSVDKVVDPDFPADDFDFVVVRTFDVPPLEEPTPLLDAQDRLEAALVAAWQASQPHAALQRHDGSYDGGGVEALTPEFVDGFDFT